MSLIELLISVVFVLAFGTGMAMTTAADSANEFMFARVCFYVAGLAVIAAYFWWLHDADRPTVPRIGIGILAALIALVGMPEAVRWVNVRETIFISKKDDDKKKEAASRFMERTVAPTHSPALRHHHVVTALPPVLEDSVAVRRAYIGQLTNLYIYSHDGISSEMLAGMQLPPEDWLNEQLAKNGKAWRVRNVQGTNVETYNAPPQVKNKTP